MVAKALLCKIKLLFKKKKTKGEKWPVSQQPSATIPPLALPLFMLRQSTGPPSIPETGVKGQHGPLDISYDNSPGCVMWGVGWGGGEVISIQEKEKNRPNDESEMRSKKLAFRKDWKAQITRSACRSSILKSIHTIHALGCQVLTAPPPPYSDSLLHRSPFWLSIIKDGILTGSYRENGCHIWWRGLREYDRLKRSCIPQCIRPPHYLYGMLLKPGQGQNRICWLLFKRIQWCM